MVRNCEFCSKSFRGVDTRRSYRRHLRERHAGQEATQVRRVVELGHPNETDSDVNQGTSSASLPRPLGAEADEVCVQETVTALGSPSRSLGPAAHAPPDGSTAQGHVVDELMSVGVWESQPALPFPTSSDEAEELQNIMASMMATVSESPVVASFPSPPPEEALQSEPLNLAMAMGLELQNMEGLPDAPMLSDEDFRALLGELNPGHPETMMTDWASIALPEPVPVNASAPSVSELAPIFAWAARLFPPYDYGQFLADASRLFPHCSVRLVTEVYESCNFEGTRPSRVLAPLPPVIVISSDSEEDIPEEDGWSMHGASPVSVAEDPNTEDSNVEDPHDEDYVPADSDEEMDSDESSSADGDDDRSSPAETSSSASEEEEEAVIVDSDSSEY